MWSHIKMKYNVYSVKKMYIHDVQKLFQHLTKIIKLQ